MAAYTVLLSTPDYFEKSCERDATTMLQVWALTPTHAAHVARGLAAVENEVEDRYEYEALAVFVGHVRDEYEPTLDTTDRNDSLDHEMLLADADTTPSEAVTYQKKWIEDHGGDLAGYLERYGDFTVSGNRYGEGGKAIYKADMDELARLETRAAKT